MIGTKKMAALALAALLPMAGCLGLFGDDGVDDQADTASIDQSVGNETAQQIQERTSGQFKNYTLPGQEALPSVTEWLNGSIGPGPTVVSQEDRNDRSGTNYNTEIVTSDISSLLPDGQPAELRLKMWYLPGPGSSGDLDLYVDVPGETTEFAADDCDEFSWKVCVQETVVNTVGKSDATQEVGVQIANNRALQGLDYFVKLEVSYAKDVITPAAPYAFEVPDNATGLVIKSEKAGGGEHINGKLLIIDPNDELVEFVEYNDLAIPTESKLIPVEGGGEYIIYALELHGGFLSVEADIPVDKSKLDGRQLEMKSETVQDGSAPSPGAGCVPIDTGGGPASGACRNQSMAGGGSTQFAAEGTFPLEVTAWINSGTAGGADANLDAEVRILSSKGLVYHAKKWVQYEDERGTIGSTRDDLNFDAYYENLAKGDYTVEYVIDGTATVGHTLTTYTR